MKIIIFATLLIVSFSCSEQKKLSKAMKRVIENPKATDSIGRHWERSHPCANDTTITTQSDTTSQLVLIDAECPPSDTATIIKIETKLKTIHDKEIQVVVDHRRENLLQADLNKCSEESAKKDAQIAGLNAANVNLTTQISDMAKKQNWLIWKNRLIVGLPLILAILGFVFRRKLPFFE